MNDIVRNGVIMAVYVFVIFVAYIVLSDPFETLMTSFEDLNTTGSDAEVEAGTGTGRTVFNMTFAGFIIVPVIWFVVWIFIREPDWRYRS